MNINLRVTQREGVGLAKYIVEREKKSRGGMGSSRQGDE